jgi:hypothetical protein
MAKRFSIPWQLVFSLLLTGSPSAIRASSLSLSGTTSATFCEGNICGNNTPASYLKNYTGPQGSALTADALSSSCLDGCMATTSVANSNFGLANNQVLIQANTGSFFNPS